MTQRLSKEFLASIIDSSCDCPEPMERLGGRECFQCGQRIAPNLEKKLLTEILELRDDLAAADHNKDHQLAKLATENSKVILAQYREIDALKAELSKWKSEYENVCKFATDYEQQRDQLRGRIAALREEFCACVHVGDGLSHECRFCCTAGEDC